MQKRFLRSAAILATQVIATLASAQATDEPTQLYLNEIGSDHYVPSRAEELQSAEARMASYSFNTAVDQVSSIPWLTAGVFAGTFAIGVADWKWGSASFHFSNEGFFGKDTHDLGMDKLGHAFGTYLLTDLFTHAIRRNAADPEGAEITAVGLSMSVMTTVELLDGFSGYGFAWQDMVMNSVGAGFSYLRNTVPGLRDKLDFRLEYVPSGNDKDFFRPYSDYSGQKYVLALKLSGFERFEDTPLRFVELQAGYFARGFTDKERE
jgi:hypothetical protein